MGRSTEESRLIGYRDDFAALKRFIVQNYCFPAPELLQKLSWLFFKAKFALTIVGTISGYPFVNQVGQCFCADLLPGYLHPQILSWPLLNMKLSIWNVQEKGGSFAWMTFPQNLWITLGTNRGELRKSGNIIGVPTNWLNFNLRIDCYYLSMGCVIASYCRLDFAFFFVVYRKKITFVYKVANMAPIF